ncbi:hypothetical protein PF002_g4217 [Phytophthora fragariae]|uniref:RxLR effector protein n=1 Tax=Phytophthora fragariae TaxID=53985 RepID=A0A6A3LXI9_9STRA|nr:hypothetical protein PF011_g5312 [Phytophthora fragariae]KAE9101057.1 hypothetical protein PF006_g22759 [Phytophthora fragariae]KAE9251586.1 hypothetical protein PF002_g4217 [Phytophthora fragariae]KAE9319967.1 hypothetical protein PF001_g5628 [Phytophthora fragariae]
MVPVTAHTKRITIAMCSFLAIQLLCPQAPNKNHHQLRQTQCVATRRRHLFADFDQCNGRNGQSTQLATPD